MSGRQAVISHVAGPGAGGRALISTRAPLTIGRDAACGLRLAGATVSRLHARLLLGPEGLVVERVSAGNPLWVNGAETERAGLRLWDLVVIGQHVLRVESLDAEATGAQSGHRPRLDGNASLLASLLEVQRLLASEEDSVVERALQALLAALPATRLALFLVAADGVVTQGPTAARGDDPLMSVAFARRVLEAGQGITLDEATGVASGFTSTMREQSVRSILGVPVGGEGGIHGILLCDNREMPGLLGPDHLPILASLARSIEHVMQRDELRRLAQERQQIAAEVAAARQVQEFLSAGTGTSGRIGTWAVAHHPARELAGDVVAMHESEAAISWLQVDVSGKGLPAALVAAMIKAAASRRLREGATPVELLTGLHGDLSGGMPRSVFFTAFAVRLQADGVFTAAGVGHPSMLVRRASGVVERFAASPGMLGLFVPNLTGHQGVLAPGDRLVLLTDGTTEAMTADGVMLGEEPIVAALVAAAGQTPAGVVAAIEAVVDAHRRGAEPNDDLTLVVGGI